VEVEGSAEVPWAETTVEAPTPTIGETGIHPTTLGAPGGAQGAPSSHKSAAPPSKVCTSFLIFLLIFCFSLSFNSRRYPFSRKHKVASVGLAPLKAMKRGAQSTPRSARPKSPPPQAAKRASSPTRKGGRRRGGRCQIPQRTRRGRRGPKSRRGRSWPSELFPLWGSLARRVRVNLDRPRRAGPRWC